MSEKHENQKKNPYNIYYENYLDTNACAECTGLIPAEAGNREEWDAYREIFNFTPAPQKPENNRE